MDDLDREIEEAARDARRRVWRGRVATIASTSTFFLVAIVGMIVVFELFPEPGVSDYEARQQALREHPEDPSAASVAADFAAYQRDRGRMRWKVLPVLGSAFAAAYVVSKRMKPVGS